MTGTDVRIIGDRLYLDDFGELYPGVAEYAVEHLRAQKRLALARTSKQV